jgi:hypothetical protein
MRIAGSPVGNHHRKEFAMKLFCCIVTFICSIGVLLSPELSFAQVARMNDTELGRVTGQAGFSDIVDHFGIKRDEATGTIYFGGEEGGYFSLADISYTGSVNLNPTAVDVTTENGVTSVTYDMSGVSVDIENFSGALRLGSSIGTGNSLGTIHIERFNVNVHGLVRVSSF